jgi:hypothetical protein
MVKISGGTFHIGSGRHYPKEAPVHRVTGNAFETNLLPPLLLCRASHATVRMSTSHIIR